MPEEQPVPDARWVNVIKPDGDVIAVPSYDIPNLAKMGWRVETPDMRRERLVQEKFGDRTLEATLAGAARGATFGISDVLLAKSGAVDPTTLAGLEEASPVASTLGEVGGVVGSAMLTKKAPTAQVTRLGQALRGATAAKLGGGALAKVAGSAAGFGAEGAIYGAGQLVSEEALGRAEFTAENLAAYAGLGAATGAGLGGAFGATGELAKATGRGLVKGSIGLAKGTEKAIGRLYEATTGQAPATGLGKAYVKASKALAKATGAVTEADEAAVLKGYTSKEWRTLATQGDEIRNKAVFKLADTVNKVNKIDKDIDPIAMGLLKRDRVAQLVSRGNEVEVISANNNIINDARQRLLAVIKTKSTPASARNTAKDALKLLNNTQAEVSGLKWHPAKRAYTTKGGVKKPAEVEGFSKVKGWSADNTDSFFKMDKLKRYFGAKKFSQAGQQMTSGLKSDAAASIRNIYDDLFRNHLLKAEVWGDDLVRMQGEVNDAWVYYLQNMGEFRKKFMSASVVEENIMGRKWSKAAYDADPEKLWAALKKTGTNDPSGVRTMGLFRQQLDARNRLTGAIRDNFELDDALSKLVKDADTAAGSVEDIIKTIDNQLAAQNQLKQMAGGTGDISATAVGYALGGAPGAIAAQAVARPDRIIRTLATLDRMMAKSQGKAVESIEAFINKSSGAVSKAAGRAGAKVRQAGPLAGLISGKAGKSAGTVSEQYNKRMLDVLDATRRPEAFTDRVTSDVSALMEDAPQVAQHLVIKELGKMAYLERELPKSPAPMTIYDTPGETQDPSQFEMSEFLQKAEVVDNPMAALAHLGNGTLTTAHVHALEETSPELYEWVRQQLMKRVPGSKMKYRARLQLAKLFRAPLDPTLNPMFIESMRPKAPQPDQQKPGPKPGGQSSSNSGITTPDRRASGATNVLMA